MAETSLQSGCSTLSTRVPELDAVLTRLASYNRRGRLVSQEIIFIKEYSMSKKLTFQEIILTLQQFWNDQGCMLMQAYDNEKVREQ